MDSEGSEEVRCVVYCAASGRCSSVVCVDAVAGSEGGRSVGRWLRN